eukprot:477787-Pleurochrysis_carterae.AAC.1
MAINSSEHELAISTCRCSEGRVRADSGRRSAWQLQCAVRASQIADFAFLLRDPGVALGYYREAAAEFKRDKAWLHYASAQERVRFESRSREFNMLLCFEESWHELRGLQAVSCT